ncbi:UNVERIFIED_CONTAM: hypothetical protein FKN15_040835 [Acipenser sinensis]
MSDASPRFPFPYQPYSIQEQFMESLYSALDQGKIGIFESPTGTGKSLSLICGALSWLRDEEERKRQEAAVLLAVPGVSPHTQPSSTSRDSPHSPSEPGWITDFVQKKAERDLVNKLKEEELRRKRREERLEQIRHNTGLRYAMKRKGAGLRERDAVFQKSDEDLEAVQLLQRSQEMMTSEGGGLEDREEEELIVAEYESDDDTKKQQNSYDDEDDDLEEEHVTKIYYCSRTHSQLSQFVHEVQKSPFGKDTRLVSLASRQVQRYYEKSMISRKLSGFVEKFQGGTVQPTNKENRSTVGLERFLQSIRAGGAPEVPSPDQTGAMEDGQPGMASPMMQIEGFLFALTNANKDGRVVLHRQGSLAQSSLKFLMLNPAVHFSAVLQQCRAVIIAGGTMQPVADFKEQLLLSAGVQRYYEKSMISRKLSGFVEKFQGGTVQPTNKENRSTVGLERFLQSIRAGGAPEVPSPDQTGAMEDGQPGMASPMMQIEGFLFALTNANKDGRVVLHRQGSLAQSSLKFLMLNPAVHFSAVLQQCRAVIIAGGTMQPVADFKEQLLLSAGVGLERIAVFSCGES